ncbi:uncharacterized protein LOC129570540 [Sitodiplosis mosellana]|uniref:uncharacterized protein LOC129570540 n=1 Tax=Sitodiplosis mosellana TaxID=263140 RepID=UPI00244458BA|nr:uncharacterized protein LOC129570540 [Sitodiplosis mosellana]
MSDTSIEAKRSIQLEMENSTAGPSRIQNSAADELSSPILKLNIDCFEELFEWLSLADLRSLRQTCKRMKQAVDYFIKINYPAVKFGFGRILIDTRILQYFGRLDPNKSKMIKRALVDAFDNPKDDIEMFKGIFPQLERLQIRIYDFRGDLHELILKWCSNLKYLFIIETVDDLMGGDNEWLNRQYPTIEHFTVDDNDVLLSGMAGTFPGLKTFFELNPKIQIFSTTMQLLRKNCNYFLGSNIKINQLNVHGDCSAENGMDEVCGILNQLYEQEFHKRLHLFIDYIDNQTDMDRITSVRGMEKLYLNRVHLGTEATITPTPDLRELCIEDDEYFENWQSMATNLVNIERIYFMQAKADVIASFMRYAPKLKEIKVQYLLGGTHFERGGVINLSGLNKERKRLAGACKVTIYVDENVFLSTKFAKAKIEFSLVILKRVQAVDWTPGFQ